MLREKFSNRKSSWSFCKALITSQTSSSKFHDYHTFRFLLQFMPAPPLVSPNFLANFPHTTLPWMIKTSRAMTHSHNKAKCANFQLTTARLSYKKRQSPSFPVRFSLPFILLKVSNSLEVSKRSSRARNFSIFSPHREFIDVKLLWQVSRAVWSDENKKRDDHDPALVRR
jgi:hypothetical protein